MIHHKEQTAESEDDIVSSKLTKKSAWLNHRKDDEADRVAAETRM